MKLVLIAIFSVIQLVVCEQQQEVVAEDTPGLYYNFDKIYGWNLDSIFDESRYDEVDHNQRADRSRDDKLREQGDRDYNREGFFSQNKNSNRADDTDNLRESYRDNDSDKNERYNKNDKNRDGGIDKVDTNRDDKGRPDKNKEYSREEKNGDKYRKKESTEENIGNGVRQFNHNIEKQESGKEKNNGNKNYERQNQYEKASRDDKNKVRGDTENDNESNYKNDKDRNKEKGDRNKDNAYNTNDREIRKYEYDSKKYDASSNNNKGKNNGNKDDRRYQEESTRDDKQDKEQNYYSDKNNGRNKSKDDYSRQSEYKESSRRDDKEKEIYITNQYKKEQQSYSRSRNENYSDNKDKSYSNRYPSYGYSYLESLITAPKPTSDSSNANSQGSKYKENMGKEKVNQKKEEVIEIHGYISKGNEKNDKQVEVDVIVKKADTAPGQGLDPKGALHIHKVLSNEENKKGYQIEEPKSELKYEYIKPGKKTESKEKDYKELFNSHVQDKKDILGGIELLGLISNIGQEIKEQVIEKIPGYNIIQKLGPRRQKSENIQEYTYDQGKKYPKIDLDVYYPPKQYEDGDKKIEDIKGYTELKIPDKETDVYMRDKNGKENVNKYVNQDRKLQVVKEIDTYKSTEISEKNGKDIYNPNKSTNIKKEKEIDVRIRTDNGNPVKGQREGKKNIYDYTIRHKQAGLVERKSQKYTSSFNYDSEKNKQENQKEEFYNFRNDNKNSEKSGISQEDYNIRQNERYQDPNYLYEPQKVNQIPVNPNRDSDFRGREYFPQGVNDGIDYEGNLRQPDLINSLQDYMKNKQKENKYVYDFTIGNLEKQAPIYNYNMPNSKAEYENLRYDKVYRPDNWYNYNSKYSYDPKPNEGWSYQGFPINEQSKGINLGEKTNFPLYVKDKDDQGIVRVGNRFGYKTQEDFRYREPYINSGYPNYIMPNYNQGLFEGGFGLTHPYPLPNIVNPLSQQILGSAGKTQKYYHQNYTKNLGNLPQQRDYNLQSEEFKPTDSYNNYEDAYNYYE